MTRPVACPRFSRPSSPTQLRARMRTCSLADLVLPAASKRPCHMPAPRPAPQLSGPPMSGTRGWHGSRTRRVPPAASQPRPQVRRGEGVGAGSGERRDGRCERSLCFPCLTRGRLHGAAAVPGSTSVCPVVCEGREGAACPLPFRKTALGMVMSLPTGPACLTEGAQCPKSELRPLPHAAHGRPFQGGASALQNPRSLSTALGQPPCCLTWERGRGRTWCYFAHRLCSCPDPSPLCHDAQTAAFRGLISIDGRRDMALSFLKSPAHAAVTRWLTRAVRNEGFISKTEA